MPRQLELDGIQFDWPDEKCFPKDYHELESGFGAFVAQQVNHHNKVDRNLSDILQMIWERLCASRFLEKFVLSAAKRYPVTMTCQEACDYLGIKTHTWMWFQQQFKENPETSLWMPEPVEGGRFSRKALYNTDEIFVLEEIREDRPRSMKPVQPRRRPKLSTYGFKAYLARTIHNHFANWCRGQDRHCKESLLSPMTLLKPLSTGVFRCRSSYSEDPPGSWENSLPDRFDLDPVDAIDAAKWMKKKGIDPYSDLGIRVLELVSMGCDVEQIEQHDVLKLKKKVRVRAVG
jgi:hypothetical protein